MFWLHCFFAILAAFRLTNMFVSDSIWQPIRVRFPSIPWYCALCMSVWGGAVATLALATVPWLNWPLAISWLYLSQELIQRLAGIKQTNGVNMTPEKITEIRYQAMVTYLQKIWEGTAQLGMQSASDTAQAQAELQEARMEIEALKSKPE